MDTITLYRAVDENELEDILRFGDYGLSPHGGGKYFALTLEGANQFANNPWNASKQMTITALEVPESFLMRGYRFNDPDGGGDSVHFDDDVFLDLCEVTGQPQILGAARTTTVGETKHE